MLLFFNMALGHEDLVKLNYYQLPFMRWLKCTYKVRQSAIVVFDFMMSFSDVNNDISSSNVSFADDTSVYNHITQIKPVIIFNMIGLIVTICSLILVNFNFYHLTHQLLVINIIFIITQTWLL